MPVDCAAINKRYMFYITGWIKSPEVQVDIVDTLKNKVWSIEIQQDMKKTLEERLSDLILLKVSVEEYLKKPCGYKRSYEEFALLTQLYDVDVEQLIPVKY